jgi:hypothetical protein
MNTSYPCHGSEPTLGLRPSLIVHCLTTGNRAPVKCLSTHLVKLKKNNDNNINLYEACYEPMGKRVF